MDPGSAEAQPTEAPPTPSPSEIPAWLVNFGEEHSPADDVPLPAAPLTSSQGESLPPTPSPQDSPLPEWLRGEEYDLNPAEELDWAADIDFSNLPDWSGDDEPPADKPAPTVALPLPSWLTTGGDGFTAGPKPDEPEGTGLLSGVRGPIPVEPVSALPHPSPRLPDVTPSPITASADAAALFAQIAAGPFPLAPVAPETKRRPSLPLLDLALLLAVIVPLALRLELFAPPASSAVPAYLSMIENLPPESLVLVAFDYESGLADDLEPGVSATLRHLNSRNARIVALSTVPQGAALAQRLWRQLSPAGAGYGEHFVNLGYVPGGEVGLRALFDQGLAERRDFIEGVPLRDLAIGQGASDLASVNLIIIASGESRDVQRWVEQIGSQRPDLPFLVATTALAAPVLVPYQASGQLHSMLGGISAVAAYEQALGASPVAFRRLDALTVAVAFFTLAVVLGNLAALVGWLRKRLGI
ncbi:MAG: hypothetical protein M5U01_11290 [Ardenticatenaceae bacterium]|nr:hypothetical protein [Ardenticatenaceae bacterium]